MIDRGWLWTFTGSSRECVWSRVARRGVGRGQTEGCGSGEKKRVELVIDMKIIYAQFTLKVKNRK